MQTDHRLAELRATGIANIWIEIADAIGFDAFMRVWSILDRDNLLYGGHRETMRINVPQMRTYLRYQRNSYIRSLATSGLTTVQIRDRIRKDLGERLSIRHLDRIIHRRSR